MEPRGASSSSTAAPVASKEDLVALLTSKELDVAAFGKGPTKTMDQLYSELQAGECVLEVLPDGRLLRLVRVVRVLVCVRVLFKTKVLVERRQRLQNGAWRDRNMILAGKCGAGEAPLAAAQREMAEELGTGFPAVRWHEKPVEDYVDKPKPSSSYPGLMSTYATTVFRCDLEDQSARDLAARGAFGFRVDGDDFTATTFETSETHGSKSQSHVWEWVPEDQVPPTR